MVFGGKWIFAAVIGAILFGGIAPGTRAQNRNNLTGLTTATLAYEPGKSPRFWSVATAETLMARYPDYREAYFRDWTYVHGYALYGFEMLYKDTGDKKYLDFMKRYIDSMIDDQGHIISLDRRNGKRGNKTLNDLDSYMTGNAIVALYEYTHEEKYKKAAETLRRGLDKYKRTSEGGFWHSSNRTGQMWIDGIFMGEMFLVRYGKSIGDTQYAYDEATKQITLYAKHGERDKTGLYVHGWSENPDKTPWADKTTGQSSEVWSEGLGWYALVVVETLGILPKDHPKYAEVLDIYKRLAAGLKKVQDPKTGRWFQVVDKGDRPDNWTDNSGSAMFTYCIARGVELGLLDRKEYWPVVVNGYKGITGNAIINDHGLVDVKSCCDGVGVQTSYDKYINYKQTLNAKEAVAGFLWATEIYERAALKEKK